MIKHPKPKNHFIEAQKSYKAFLFNTDKSGYLSMVSTGGLLVEKEKNFLKNILNAKYPLEESIDALERLTYVYLLHTEYCLYVAKDKEKALVSLQKSYGYHILMTYIMISCDSVFATQKSFGEEAMALGMSLHFLFSGSLEKNLLLFLLDKVESSSTIQAPFVFVSKLMEAETISDVVFPATLEYPYNTIKEVGQSEHGTKIDRVASMMCDMHIELSKEDGFFSNLIVKLFPYEILVWLKLREKAGLKNPKTFTHPLMKTPIAKMFLDLKEPLPKPTELPYAKELLEKIQEKCPNVQIPQWLEETTTQLSNQHKEKHYHPTHAPITGKYQAHLPSGHPDKEKIKLNPFAYNTYTQGEPFSYEGLEEYDESLIEWRLREE
jgi:hypothetical protein